MCVEKHYIIDFKLNTMQRFTFLMLLNLAFTSSLLAQSAGFNPRALEDAEETKQVFIEKHPKFQDYFDEAYGYVIFPAIGKGASVIGGAHGNGTAFEQGEPIGKAKLTQVTIGFQFGGQSYRQVIFFETKDDLERFKENRFEFAAQASAVAIEEGAAANFEYTDGVAVFTIVKAGLMYEASLGGQKLKFKAFEKN